MVPGLLRCARYDGVILYKLPRGACARLGAGRATRGEDYKHWFLAKFLQQFRLFFRYQQSADAKIIVLAWVNDDETLRAYESANDAYAVFRKMLKRGDPPDSWKALLTAASNDAAKRRLSRSKPGG